MEIVNKDKLLLISATTSKGTRAMYKNLEQQNMVVHMSDRVHFKE